MRIYFATITALFLVSLESCSGGKPVDDRFAFKLQTDSVFHLTVEIRDSGGRAGSRKQQWIEFTMQKLQDKDSSSVIKLVIDRLGIAQPAIQLAESRDGSIVVMPAGTWIHLSTEDSTADQKIDGLLPEYYETWAAILPKLKGDSMQVIMNSRGEAEQVTGFERITEKITRETATDIRVVRQYLDDYAGNESVRDLLNQLFFYLPGKKIQKGDHWVKNVTMTANAPVKLSHLITVKEVDIERDEVLLYIQSVVSAKTSEEGRQYGEGELTGYITASYRTGLPHRIDLIQIVTTHTDQYDVVTRRVIQAPRYWSPL
jgi:hypothetical protein